MIRQDILQRFPDLFGTKKVNGRDINVEETIAALTRELRPEIAAALTARRRLLQSSEPVRKRYAWPKWDETFRRSGEREALDVSSHRARADRQLPRARERVALAAQRRGAHPERRPPIGQSRPGAHRALASAGHGVQRPEQPGAHEHAGFRRRLAAPLPTRWHAGRRAGRDLRGHAERQGDLRGPLERTSLRGGEERERRARTGSTRLPRSGRRASAARPACTCATTTSRWTASRRPA